MSKKILMITCFSACFCNGTTAQNKMLSINGPLCVLAGGSNGVYYSISGNLQDNDNISWEISGGDIVGKGSNINSGTVSVIGKDVRVIWNRASKAGTIKVTSRVYGVTTLQINIVTIFNRIDSVAHAVPRFSSIRINGDGPDISCNTAYTYWWEVSDSADGPFIQVERSNTKNLIKDSIKNNGFYRRVLSVNGDNIYSNVIYIKIADLKISSRGSFYFGQWAKIYAVLLRNYLKLDGQCIKEEFL